MWKRIISLILARFCLIVALPQVRAAELNVAAPAAVLMEAATGTILYEKESHTRLAPASVTKVMTLLLVMEALESGRISWDDTVTASETISGLRRRCIRTSPWIFSRNCPAYSIVRITAAIEKLRSIWKMVLPDSKLKDGK